MKNNIFKRFASIAVCISLLLSAQMINPVDVSAQQIRVVVNGVQVNFPDAQPVIVEGRTLVPMRGVFEQMGFAGDWNPQTETSTLMRSGMTVSVRRGDPFFIVNGVQQFPEVPPQLLGGRFMIPLRAVAESTGAGVNWNDHTRTVIITTGTPITTLPAPVTPVVPAPMPTVPVVTPSFNIANQTGQLVAGVAGSVDFQVMTNNVPNGTYQLALRGNVPNGVTLQSTSININNNSGILRLNGSSATQQGTFLITVGINLGANRGWVEQNLTLVVSQTSGPPGAFQLTVGNQIGTLAQGSAGQVQYSITTQNLPNGNYNVALAAPFTQGVSLGANAVAISNNSGLLQLATNGTTPAGQHNINLAFTIGTGAQAVTVNRQAILTIGGGAVPNITNITPVSGGNNPPIQGMSGGWIQYNVTTQNVPNGSYNVALTAPVPQGVSLAANNITINNGGGFVVLSTNGNTPAGTHNVNLAFTLGTGAQAVTINRNVAFTVLPSGGGGGAAPTISGAGQSGNVSAGSSNTITLWFNVQNSTSGSRVSNVTSSPPGLSVWSVSNLDVDTTGTGQLDLFVDATSIAPGSYTIQLQTTLPNAAGNNVTITHNVTLFIN
ncbi:MAG: copper amine oxidase N-terminal domain-containing protein [Defluviitaleaceae bacterium]|nr:copper amine oxidase N-terminal domain-containing protein [Defluviitaleaceae bacterium]